MAARDHFAGAGKMVAGSLPNCPPRDRFAGARKPMGRVAWSRFCVTMLH